MAAAMTLGFPPRDPYQGYPQQYAMQQGYREPAVTSVSAASLQYPSVVGYGQQLRLQAQPSESSQPSKSPVSEDGQRLSLPSISNLLGIADGEQTSQDAAKLSDGQTRHERRSLHQQQQMHPSLQAHVNLFPPPPPPQDFQTRRDLNVRPSYPEFTHLSRQRVVIPSTPPLRNDSVLQSGRSSVTPLTGVPLSAPGHFAGSALNNVEAADQHRHVHRHFIKRHSVPARASASPYETSSYQTSPGAMSASAVYHSPMDPPYPTAATLYSQRPLPTNFPPPPSQAPLQSPAQASTATGSGDPLAPPGAPNPWEHHHYISPSSQAVFPPSQDRYICPTCSKAFSRPSSLKIHSHSHSGEKPFKCPHAGCGKAFSVRSNMKRHERGCHSGGAGGTEELG